MNSLGILKETLRRAEQDLLNFRDLILDQNHCFIFPYQFHKTQLDPLTMKKPPETTYSVGSLHPMVQSYEKFSEMWKDIQNPQKYYANSNEGIFNLPVSTFFTSNPKALPFWDEDFLKEARWDWFMKSPTVDTAPNNPETDEPTIGDEDNLWMTLANPYLKAVKHGEAAKKALKNKQPIWIGPRKFRYRDVPKTMKDENGVEKNNRNLATLNMLNWFTHNSYLELPMSQRMALYFDSRAVEGVESGIGGIGQLLGSTQGIMGIGGIIGGMFGGPAGAIFGSALSGFLGRKFLGSALGKFLNGLGSVIGAATGFLWNASGKNSLTENQKRQLPGFMCILPKDKLEIYIKSLFHMSLYGKNHARLPFNHFTTAENYPDKLAAVLGKSEISFTFTLTDRIKLTRYDADTGNVLSKYNVSRTTDIGQEKKKEFDSPYWHNKISLIDEYAQLLHGFQGRNEDEKDPRIQWDGYGYIIEGFNVKCCGKVPYTLTFYSPQGYLEADNDGNLEEGEKEYKSPYNRPSYAVWRGQYLSQALFADDTRLWNNTKNLAKPHHVAYVPFRYPRACLPVPPVDLKDPSKWLEDNIIDIKTLYVIIDGHRSDLIGDLNSRENIKWKDEF